MRDVRDGGYPHLLPHVTAAPSVNGADQLLRALRFRPSGQRISPRVRLYGRAAPVCDVGTRRSTSRPLSRASNDANPAAASIADPERDMFTALERGVAPARLVGSGLSPLDPGKTMTRPLCPYPQQVQYKGNGATDDAANFVCAVPAK